MNNKWTIGFAGSAAVLLLLSAIIGFNGNPFGLAMLNLGLLSSVLAIVHRWRTLKQFALLLSGSAVGFFVAVILHNLFDVLADKASGIFLVEPLLTALAVAFFFVAICLCPVGALVGIVGSMTVIVRKQFHKERATDDA